MPGVNKYKDGVVAPALQGPAGPGEEPQDHLRRGHRPAGQPDHGRGRRPARTRAATSCSPPARCPSRCPAWSIDGEPRHHQRPRAAAGPRPGVRRRPRRRRHRLRVRQRLAVLRRRGDDRRGAAAPGARSRTRPASKLLERAFRKRKISFELGARFAGVEKTENGVRVSLENGKTIEADLLLVAVGRGPVSQELGYEQVGVEMERGFVKVDAHCQTNVADDLRGRRPHPDPAARARRLRRGHPGRRAARRARPGADRLRRRPAGHLLRARGRLGRASPRRGPRRSTATTASRPLTYDLAGNGKSQILKTAGFVKLVRQKDGPVVGVHMVGSRVGELVAEAQLIYNWEALPRRGRPAHPRPPHPDRGRRRGAPRAGRQAPARARLTHPRSRRPEGDREPMSTSVTMPALGESVTEGTVTRWLKQEGDAGRRRRAAARGLHRQGRHRDPVPRLRRAAARSSSARTRPSRSAPSSPSSATAATAAAPDEQAQQQDAAAAAGAAAAGAAAGRSSSSSRSRPAEPQQAAAGRSRSRAAAAASSPPQQPGGRSATAAAAAAAPR